jgi:hypothetical protein
MFREQAIHIEIEKLIEEIKKHEDDEDFLDRIKPKLNRLEHELTAIYKKKKEIGECIILDIVVFALEDFHNKQITAIRNLKNTTLFNNADFLMNLNEYRLREHLDKMTIDELKYFIILILNNSQNYYEQLYLEELEDLSKKLLADKT